jgi:hypothetical protein
MQELNLAQVEVVSGGLAPQPPSTVPEYVKNM